MRHLLIVMTFVMFTYSVNAQLLNKYGDFGLCAGSKALVKNKNEFIADLLNYDLSLGVYYNFVNSDYFSFPIYIQYSRNHLHITPNQEKIVFNNLDIDVDFRIYAIQKLLTRVYFEGGISCRSNLGINVFYNSVGNMFDFKKILILPKLIIGFELYGKEQPFVYLNFEYYRTISGLLNSSKRPLNNYLGVRASFPLIMKK